MISNLPSAKNGTKTSAQNSAQNRSFPTMVFKLKTARSLTLALSLAVGTFSCSNEATTNQAINESAATPEVAVATSVSDNAKLEQMLEAVYQRRVGDDPVLGSRVGAQAAENPWFDLSLASWDREFSETQQDLAALRDGIDVDSLDAAGRINYLAFEADLLLRLERYRWRFHLNPINQIVGPHLTIAGTLLNSHPIDSRASAEFYIQRLQAANVPMQQLVEHLQARRAQGIVIPAAVVERLIDGAKSIIAGDHTDNVILADFNKKLADVKLSDKDRVALQEAATAAYQSGFVPGYELLIEDLQVELTAANQQGAWSLPEGAEFYEFLIDQYTTADFSAEEIHALGLAEVARIQSEMDEIRKRVEFDGDLGEFFTHLKTDSAFYLPNTDAGRAAYLQMAQDLVNKAKTKLGDVLPYALPHPLQVRRIEAFREESAPVGFYESGSPDNDYVGTIYLGMHDMSSLGTYDLPALLFHEGLPGHHLQSSVMLSRDIPQIRKYYVWWSNTAFTEGWALYAESLADELGLYEDDYAQFGRLAGELWRACRLVVDSGLHLKQWSRDEAIGYLNENTASSEENNARAVDRYLAVPGQATAFKIGMQVIRDLRTEAEQQLGSDFDVTEFHALVLENGPLPLSLLGSKVEAWVLAKSKAATPKT
ncbi:DUF885 domain-containing protein [Arenicella xantha]|uniref:Uncharacterized protein (DUF885 family) n=1 Tax=Arenicella xantha TaxID=644221 RepID=A0A395JPP0_9GAMM|nr:DUF885 domain-containing protein [Arenicella xantha]RBP53569.1 uncharacterized protein (DUF885 family) [Arenicella xantha]